MGGPRCLSASGTDWAQARRGLAKRHVDKVASVSLVVPLTTNLDRANLAGTALVSASSVGGLPQDSVALAFQMRAIPKSALQAKIRDLQDGELEELELATDEALGRVEPKSP